MWRLLFAIAPDRVVGLLAVVASIALGAALVRRHLADRLPEAVVVASLLGYLLLGYTWQPGDGGAVAAVLREISHWVAPVVALAAAVALVMEARRARDHG